VINLILIRGMPGAGKTTFARLLCNGLVEADGVQWFEADEWWGRYNDGKFDPTKLGEAHRWCRAHVETGLASGFDVVVTNTFTQEWELKPYYELARTYNARLHSLIVERRRDNATSIHDIPAETLKKMEDRFEVCI
jgi:predicted kinase